MGGNEDGATGVGEVWLVGAGPGDPGLLTIRGKEILEQADVVVHDRLINPALLRLAHRAQLIDVGKSLEGGGYRQEEIDRLLVELARQGKLVVRLKGGDPYVFGRGGEEALALASAGIPHRVVAGVTAASGCAAWTGVPLTHRGLASSLALVTGHEDPGKVPQVDWRRLAGAVDTLVVYMGVERLDDIVAGLLAGGRDAGEPALLVQEGTRARQKVVTGRLGSLPARAREEGVEPPALLVVGRVASLRERLSWYEHLPLSGCRVALTRPRVTFASGTGKWDMGEWERAGAEVEVYHVLRLQTPADPEPLRQAVRDLGRFQWVLFTSSPGVAAFFHVLAAEGGDARALAGCRVGAVGMGTAATLEQHGIRPDVVPTPHTVDALVDEVCRQLSSGARVLLPRSDLVSSQAEPLRRAGAAEVREVVAYSTVTDGEEAARLVRDAMAGQVDVLVLTSSQAARAVAASTGAAARAGGAFPGVEPLVVVIGPVTARTCHEASVRVAAVAPSHNREGLLRTVTELWQRHQPGV